MQEKIRKAVTELHNANEDTPESVMAEIEQTLGGAESLEIIQDLQSEKREVMLQLRTQLKQLDEEGTVGSEGVGRQVAWNEASSSAEVYGKGGSLSPISEGQLLNASCWGEEYFINESVPRELKKRFLIAQAQFQVEELYDHQIAASEMNKRYNRNTGLDDAYKAVHEGFSSEGMPNGILAEKMIASFLNKLMIDHDMPYTIKKATVYEDVEYKIDFIIAPKDSEHRRGAVVENPEERTDIGVQFTTVQERVKRDVGEDEVETAYDRKIRQVDRMKSEIKRNNEIPVNDLVLVTLPMRHVRQTYDEWKATKPGRRIPGGPDELWSEEFKKQILDALLQGIVAQEAVDAAWQKTLIQDS